MRSYSHRFSVTGKLIGGHQAAVMCLAVGPDVVVTGSKDHYIKLFDLETENEGPPVGILTPRVTLDPPHYDGIQCLELSGDVLFSGSRDGIIKKWNTQSNELLCVSLFINVILHVSIRIMRLVLDLL